MPKQAVWIGRMTEDQAKNGGIWTIGNSPYDPDPNYPGKNNGEFFVKSWVATPKKYGGNYPPKDRTAEGLWEYVRVFTGILECQIHMDDGSIQNTPLLWPKDGVEIPPQAVRSWRLPKGYIARGITICSPKRLSERRMENRSHEYYAWDEYSLDFILRYVLSRRSLTYLEVFAGNLEVYPRSQHLIAFTPGRHAFLMPTRFNFHAHPGTKGVLILIESAERR